MESQCALCAVSPSATAAASSLPSFLPEMTLEKTDAVEVFAAGEKGRGLRTTKEMLAGEVVFSEAGFAAVVFDSLSMQVCHSCFCRQANLHRCAQCMFACYCDRTCQGAAWEEHKQECAAIKRLGKAPNENTRLVARILWHTQKHTGKVSDNQLTTLDLLEDHISDMAPEDLKELKVAVHNFLEYWPSNSKQYGVEYISHIFGVINCNAFILSDQRGLQAVGVGIFPNLCLVNHDCWPNCTVILNHGNQTALDTAFHSQRRIELRALGTILEGEELTVSYVDFLNLSTERKQLLKKQYYFDCECEHCSHGIKDDLMMGTQEIGGKKVVQICRECLEKQELLLADTHLYVLRVLRMISEVLSFQQQFQEAAEYARRMVDGYAKLYPPNNALLGMATMRAGVTNWHAGLIEVGHGMICKAYAILLITHGPHHPITKDLERMRTQTEMELHMFKQNEKVYHSMREVAVHNKPSASQRGKVQ
ncbi:histone-lysine N-methyltransferase SMYD1a isoform X2 [Electrophorus electricus]|uniref:histone-lysine N-methyltransferase SMYD1a isoform X2 n=1 Tax=Electrophorus electricus TaxID=8005 RepID=UPI0015D04E68|nr:histone-lysine N-methyltransferase SMYD1a isoform X2 [Electrophorus electricus]